MPPVRVFGKWYRDLGQRPCTALGLVDESGSSARIMMVLRTKTRRILLQTKLVCTSRTSNSTAFIHPHDIHCSSSYTSYWYKSGQMRWREWKQRESKIAVCRRWTTDLGLKHSFKILNHRGCELTYLRGMPSDFGARMYQTGLMRAPDVEKWRFALSISLINQCVSVVMERVFSACEKSNYKRFPLRECRWGQSVLDIVPTDSSCYCNVLCFSFGTRGREFFPKWYCHLLWRSSFLVFVLLGLLHSPLPLRQTMRQSSTELFFRDHFKA